MGQAPGLDLENIGDGHLPAAAVTHRLLNGVAGLRADDDAHLGVGERSEAGAFAPAQDQTFHALFPAAPVFLIIGFFITITQKISTLIEIFAGRKEETSVCRKGK